MVWEHLNGALSAPALIAKDFANDLNLAFSANHIIEAVLSKDIGRPISLQRKNRHLNILTIWMLL